MGKTLVLSIALSLVLGGGFFVNAQAECGCPPHTSMSSFCVLNGSHCSKYKDMDKDSSSDQKSGAENPNPGSFKHDATGKGVSSDPGQDKAGY
jgi:hypothetical protein